MINTLISNVSERSISNFIRSRNSSFIEYKEDLSYLVNDFDQFDNLNKLGEIEYDNTDVLLVFSCAYNGLLSTRSARKMQFEIAKKALKEDFKDGAVFVFYDDVGNFRFSFIRKNYGDKEQKYSNWKRFTYFVDPESQTNRTFKGRIGNCNFDSLENIQNAFSVEPISIEFFDGYKAQYEKFCSFMQADKKMQNNFREFLTDGTNKAIRDYVKKMLGRIVFLHFLQKKGWMGVPKDTKSWTDGDTNFIENFFKNSSKEQKDNFLDEVLEPMFFESLNKRRHNDWYDTKTSIGIVKIPYLNGGLFEPDKIDKPDSRFPSSYFKELFQFFNQFNFTIDENDPNDAEVGVDPEMLGHIFENLLEDNKDKGAFYTPKEIVHYMCQESLIEYLYTALNIDNTDEKGFIQVLVKYHVIDAKLCSRISEINAALDSVKICDPAIGSGAFPMGLLHEIFSIKQILWYFENNDIETFPASEVKLNIIQNSIYGVDIEKGAVDIARLRFWLSLVVDEDEPKALPNLDYKIACGNSLISRFPLDKPINDVFAEYNKGKSQKFTLQDYKYLMSDYINVHEGKDIFKNKIEEIKGAFKSVLLEGDLIKRKKKEAEVLDFETIGLFGERKADTDKAGYKKVKSVLELLLKAEKEVFENKIFANSFEWRFEFPALLDEEGIFIGFDIVIGNPPYGNLFDDSQKEYIRNRYTQIQFKVNAYSVFLILGYKLLKDDGIINYIIPSTFMDNKFDENVRELFLSNQVKLIHELDDKIFQSAVVHSMIFSAAKTNNLDDYYVRTSSDIILNKEKELIPHSFFLNQQFKSFTIRTFKNNDFMNKFRENSVNLDTVIDIRQAIKSGNDTKYIGKEKVNNNWKPILGGKHIKKYEIKDPELYINYGKHLACPRDKNIFEQEKILIREAGNSIIATYDNLNYYIMSSLYNAILINSDFNLKYILALLNSSTFQFFMKNLTFDKTSGAFTKAKIFHYYTLPVKNASKTVQQIFVTKVDELLSLKSNGKEGKSIEKEIDYLVYRLYELTFYEIKLIDQDDKLNLADYESIKLV